jgi:uncharacterized DUF497 family protein
MQFEWDPSKAQSNVRKHGVTLDEAATVFDDPYARIIDDPDHSVVEERFIILGMSMRARARRLALHERLEWQGGSHHIGKKGNQKGSPRSIGGTSMRSEYDFSGSVENPYVRKPHSQVTMNLDDDVISYFKRQAADTGIPYQRLINLYLSQCVSEGKKLAFV